jgi:hypothetical protein
MIPLEKETEIQKMLTAGTPQSVIAATVKVGASTVARISRSMRIANEFCGRERGKVKLLIISGMSPEAISARLGFELEAVKAIMRADLLLQYVVEKPHPCPTCGTVMLPEEPPEEHDSVEIPLPSEGQTRELCALADEVIGLSKAMTIRNLLFYDIADRMERLFATILKDNENG